MMSLEGSEALVDADEYLQPKSRVSPGTTMVPESPTPQNQTNWDREIMRCSADQHQPSRYCSDPLSRGLYNIELILLNINIVLWEANCMF